MADKTTYNALSGMANEIQRQEIIARNLAAANMIGYKREYVVSKSFSETLQDKLTPYESVNNLSGSINSDVKVDFSQGSIKKTDRTLDFAIEGRGFFEVITSENKKLYTRNGAFQIDKDGNMVTAEGYKVNGLSGTIGINTNDQKIQNLEVTGDGILRIRKDMAQKYKMEPIAQFRIVDIDDKSKLTRISANYFTLPDSEQNLAKPVEANPEKYPGEASNAPFMVVGGAVESSNTSPVRDMVAMVRSQREFEMGQKVIKMLEKRFDMELRKLTG